MLGGAGRTKEWNDKGRQKWRDTLTRKAPYKPYAGKPHVRICAGGGEQSPSLPRPTCAVHQVDRYLRYTGRGAKVVRKAAIDLKIMVRIYRAEFSHSLGHFRTRAVQQSAPAS